MTARVSPRQSSLRVCEASSRKSTWARALIRLRAFRASAENSDCWSRGAGSTPRRSSSAMAKRAPNPIAVGPPVSLWRIVGSCMIAPRLATNFEPLGRLGSFIYCHSTASPADFALPTNFRTWNLPLLQLLKAHRFSPSASDDRTLGCSGSCPSAACADELLEFSCRYCTGKYISLQYVASEFP